MNLIKIFAIVSVLTSQACSYAMHQVHVSDFSPYHSSRQGKIIEANAEQFTIMGFVTETIYVEQAQQNLIDQCKGGSIEGITTEFNTAHGFFSWKNRIIMQALCIN